MKQEDKDLKAKENLDNGADTPEVEEGNEELVKKCADMGIQLVEDKIYTNEELEGAIEDREVEIKKEKEAEEELKNNGLDIQDDKDDKDTSEHKIVEEIKEDLESGKKEEENKDIGVAQLLKAMSTMSQEQKDQMSALLGGQEHVVSNSDQKLKTADTRKRLNVGLLEGYGIMTDIKDNVVTKTFIGGVEKEKSTNEVKFYNLKHKKYGYEDEEGKFIEGEYIEIPQSTLGEDMRTIEVPAVFKENEVMKAIVKRSKEHLVSDDGTFAIHEYNDGSQVQERKIFQKVYEISEIEIEYKGEKIQITNSAIK